MKLGRIMVSALLLAGLAAAGSSHADGEVELVTSAMQEVTVTGADGRQQVEMRPASKVVPGDEVLYTISAMNGSRDTIEGVVIHDPIPEHMTYVPGSAGGEGSDVSFSVDGGKTFGDPARLQVIDEGGTPRKAEAADYTDIKWTLRDPLGPSATRSVSFRARLD